MLDPLAIDQPAATVVDARHRQGRAMMMAAAILLLLLVGTLPSLVPGELLAAEPVPNAFLDVTVRQKVDGKPRGAYTSFSSHAGMASASLLDCP
jgi:hypothetical protein